MAMVIKNNMPAKRILNELDRNAKAMQKDLSKVSSGLKVRSAEDDASGYAISERMDVQINSLEQANQNTQNGSSMMKTAEGKKAMLKLLNETIKEQIKDDLKDINEVTKLFKMFTIQKVTDSALTIKIQDEAEGTFNRTQ